LLLKIKYCCFRSISQQTAKEKDLISDVPTQRRDEDAQKQKTVVTVKDRGQVFKENVSQKLVFVTFDAEHGLKSHFLGSRNVRFWWGWIFWRYYLTFSVLVVKK